MNLDDILQAVNDEPETVLSALLRRSFGVDCWDDSSIRSAERIMDYWHEFRGTNEPDFGVTVFEAPAENLVVVKDIEFSSLCAHHLLPFYGKAHVGYIPHKVAVGLSKIPRLVDFWSHRPQMQERLTEQIANDLVERLKPHGVAVVLEARHTCMACRGVEKHNGSMITSTMRGMFLVDKSADVALQTRAASARAEFLALIARSNV